MIRYVPVDEHTSNTDRNGFIIAYQEAFAGPPYFESYTDQEVLDEVWYPHLRDGITVLALDGSKVVGFGCAVPLTRAPTEIQVFLAAHHNDSTLSVDLGRAWYMSELGVLVSYRNRGIGYALVRHRLHTISRRGDTHYVFRTAAEGSNSIHLYRKIGAIELPDTQDVSASDQVKVNSSRSMDRVYLYGDCASALRELPTI